MRRRDHPRIRGKDSMQALSCIHLNGSPSHTRERQIRNEEWYKWNRITPAYAGKTVDKASRVKDCEDHPRIRGKDVANSEDQAIDSGSPPHTRERRQAVTVSHLQHRITPAYAGKTEQT